MTAVLVDSKSAAQVRQGDVIYVEPPPSWWKHDSQWLPVRKSEIRSAKRQREAQQAVVERSYRGKEGWWCETNVGRVGPSLGQCMIALVPESLRLAVSDTTREGG